MLHPFAGPQGAPFKSVPLRACWACREAGRPPGFDLALDPGLRSYPLALRSASTSTNLESGLRATCLQIRGCKRPRGVVAETGSTL
jgi:hypothetical protein